MISKVSARIADVLCKSLTIQECDRELYQYGIFILLSHIFFFLLVSLFGVVLRIPGESIVFYIMFSLLRSYAGGVHAKTEKACTMLTALTMLICIMAIQLLEKFDKGVIAIPILVAGTICVFTFSPLDTDAKPLEPDERKHYKKITEIITILYVTVALFSYYTGHSGILSSVSVSVFVEGVLLVTGKMLKVQHETSVVPENQP